MEMTSNCDVTNSAHQIQMTTIRPWTKPPLMKIFCVRNWKRLTVGEINSVVSIFLTWLFVIHDYALIILRFEWYESWTTSTHVFSQVTFIISYANIPKKAQMISFMLQRYVKSFQVTLWRKMSLMGLFLANYRRFSTIALETRRQDRCSQHHIIRTVWKSIPSFLFRDIALHSRGLHCFSRVRVPTFHFNQILRKFTLATNPRSPHLFTLVMRTYSWLTFAGT